MAQNNIQQKSLFTSEKINVDGKLNEWGDGFKAYNRSTLLSYTISNNEKILYLIVKCKDVPNINKILRAGITFLINEKGLKKVENAVSVTYPIPIRSAGRAQAGGQPVRVIQGGGQIVVQAGGGQIGSNPTQVTQKQRDSATISRGIKQLASAVEIKVKGINSIPDSVISIYNEFSIKALASINSVGEFEYELAIPLNLLNLNYDNPREFSYNIKVNGIQVASSGSGVQVVGSGSGRMNTTTLDMSSPTDVWGKYILAKK